MGDSARERLTELGLCKDDEYFLYDTSAHDRKIPSCWERYISVDEGISSPKHLRSTFSVFPSSAKHATFVPFPMALHLQPFARHEFPQEEIPFVKTLSSGMFCCPKCKAYVNPFFRFALSDRFFRCNICQSGIDVTNELLQVLDIQRINSEQESVEQNKGTIEFAASESDIDRLIPPLMMVFCIDASKNSCSTSLFAVITDMIRQALEAWDTIDDFQVGFVIFDSKVHLLRFSEQGEKCSIETIDDVNEPFLPSPAQNYLIKLHAFRSQSKTLIDQLLGIFDQPSKNPGSSMGAAVEICQKILSRKCGKLVVFQAAAPSLGKGSLQNRESLAIIGSEKEKSLYTESGNFYSQLSVLLRTHLTSVDIFCFGNSYLDVASVGLLSGNTGGSVYYYPSFKIDRDSTQFKNELLGLYPNLVGRDIVIRIKSSQGFRVTKAYGPIFQNSSVEFSSPMLNQSSSICFLLDMDTVDSPHKQVYFQIQVVYTTLDQERRVRVFNVEYSASNDLSTVFANVDVECLVSSLMKMASRQLPEGGAKEVREGLIARCVACVTAFRTYIPRQPSPYDLGLPESLKDYPIFLSCSLKSDMFRMSQYLRIDHRISIAHFLNQASIQEVLLWVHPRLYGFELTDIKERSRNWLPQVQPLFCASLSQSKIYLLETNMVAYIWTGANVPIQYIARLVEIDSWTYDEYVSMQRVLLDFNTLLRGKIARHSIDPECYS
eukprot:TRINITY_DN4389_c0_g1_i8.p1 TRINITY_DN4389_c0_g1~~TRINITY_DN4389_c0_g1_i8.p1  ORF type:complete len:718 (+),score=119.42 TRINITY_DN4389_c0_g1_i8:27-2180(+)